MYTDVLNSAPNDPLNPDYGWDESDSPSIATFKPRQGPRYSRRLDDRGQSWSFTWSKRPLAAKRALQQWARRFEQGYFSMACFEFPKDEVRYYSGYFSGPLQVRPEGFERWTIKGTFVEEPGRQLFAYPTNWARDGVLLTSLDDNGDGRWLLAGAWQQNASALACGADPVRDVTGSDWSTSQANDTAVMGYYGYGFRLWARKGPDLGQVSVMLDGVAVATVDLYAAAPVSSQPVLELAAAVLALHRVTLVCAGTKNNASSAITVVADALEVMR